MKRIIQIQPMQEGVVKQYCTKYTLLTKNTYVVEIDEKYNEWLKKHVVYEEEDFFIELGKHELDAATKNLLNQSIGFAYIGNYQKLGEWTFYEIDTDKEKQISKNLKGICINAYSQIERITASQYIQTIDYILQKATIYNIPFIIYLDINIPDTKYRYRSFTQKIINERIKQMNVLLICFANKQEIKKYYKRSQKEYEFYLEHTIYLHLPVKEAIYKAINFINRGIPTTASKLLYRIEEIPYLYEDVFYKQIPLDEWIYLLPNYAVADKASLERLGIKVIEIGTYYHFLYAPKRIFEKNQREIKKLLKAQYFMPIATFISPMYGTCIKSCNREITASNYTGKDVYIGIITTESIAFNDEMFYTKEKKTRIAYAWEQKLGNQGDTFLEQDINAMPIIVNNELTNTAQLLKIAGNASDAQFIIAKIHTAPVNLQKIYGGTPTKEAILLPDLFIGITKLMEFVMEKKKPLVLMIPFDTNIDNHTGTSSTYAKLLQMATRQPGVTVIFPSGEEADKRHHAVIFSNKEKTKSLGIRINKDKEIVVGIIHQKANQPVEITLTGPNELEDKTISLTKKADFIYGNTKIYTSGEEIEFDSGEKRIIFSIETDKKGEWQMAFYSKEEHPNEMHLWLAQQPLNKATIDSPEGSITIGGLACTEEVLTVGAFNPNTLTVLRASGRGYNGKNQIKPEFVTKGEKCLFDEHTKGLVKLYGTVVAASITAGIVAAFYEQLKTQNNISLPNTQVIKQLLFQYLENLEPQVYPNISEGYGILDCNR